MIVDLGPTNLFEDDLREGYDRSRAFNGHECDLLVKTGSMVSFQSSQQIQYLRSWDIPHSICHSKLSDKMDDG